MHALHSLLASAAILVGVSVASAQESVSQPAGQMPARPRRVHPMAALMANPAAWVEPEHFIAVVNEGGAVDPAWLAEFVPGIAKYCQLRFEVIEIAAEADVSPAVLVARARAAAGENALAFLVLANDFADPVVTAPGSGWAVVNPTWVRGGETVDEEKIRDRMGKQLYRALGLAFGAGFRIEHEAVLRDAPTPASLDEALSRNFHPQNLSVIQSVAQRMGLELRHLKPREELESMGLLKPRTPKPEQAAPVDAAPTAN